MHVRQSMQLDRQSCPGRCLGNAKTRRTSQLTPLVRGMPWLHLDPTLSVLLAYWDLSLPKVGPGKVKHGESGESR
eukprot:9271771-Lingulodinium_polyedra.AAC.1